MKFTGWQEAFSRSPVEGYGRGRNQSCRAVDSRLIKGMTLVWNSNSNSLKLVVWWLPYSLRPTRAAFGGVAGFDPVLFAALVLVGVLVTHGRQLTDDPRRGVLVEVRAVGDHLGGFVGQYIRDRIFAGEPDGAGQVPSRVGLFREHFQQDEIVAAFDLLFQVFAINSLHYVLLH